MLEEYRDISALREAWPELHSASVYPSVFTSYEWQASWWQYFGAGAELRVLALRKGKQLQALAPLMKRDDTYYFVGGRAVSDYLDLIARPDAVGDCVDAVCEHLQAQPWSQVHLRGFRADSPFLPLLVRKASSLGWSAEVSLDEVSPIATLPATWDQYLAGLDKKERHELRRKLRRLDSHAPWVWYSVPPEETTAQRVGEFLALMRLSRDAKAAFLNPTMEEFFAVTLCRLAAAGLARLYFLDLNGRHAAAATCLSEGDSLLLYNSGYDPAYAELSTGIILKAMCVQDAIRLGCATFDFLRGRESYKHRLGGLDRPVHALTLCRDSQPKTVGNRFLDEMIAPEATATGGPL